jgi:hypothetical protein
MKGKEMDNNNFEKEQQIPTEEPEKSNENQPTEENATSKEYYNNGPRLPKSTASAKGAKGGAAVSSKDKLAVIISMGALALILISVVMLITFCGGASGHEHSYTYSLNKDGDTFVLLGKCSVDGCSNPNSPSRRLYSLFPLF